MQVLYTEEFQKQFHKLPSRIRSNFYKQERIFKNSWHDPRLHIKKLIEHQFTFSFRVTRSYRVLFIFTREKEVTFATIAHRKDSYR